MAVWRGPRGILVEVIVLNTSQRFKVTQDVGGRHYLIGYYASPADLVKYVDLADLVEVIPFPG